MDYARIGIILVFASAVRAQAPDPAYPFLERAYAAVRVKDWDTAVSSFDRALQLQPNRADVHKDLAYALLKAGETEGARDHFKNAVDLDPSDEHVALEYAFLCYETRQPVEARRTFDRLSKEARTPETKSTARQAFENVDGPLRDGIARYGDFQRAFKCANALDEFCPAGAEIHGNILRHCAERLPGSRPACAALFVAHQQVTAPVVAGGIFAPARDRKVAPSAKAGPAVAQHHTVCTVGEQAQPTGRLGRGRRADGAIQQDCFSGNRFGLQRAFGLRSLYSSSLST